MKLSVKDGRDGKVHIYVDEEYTLTVDGNFWYTSQWCAKREIDDLELEEMTGEIHRRRAFNNAVSLLSRRMHSRYELFQKLNGKYTGDEAEYACSRCEELGLLNDESFAELYADELLRRKSMGVTRIKQELRRKGIDNDIIQNVVDELDIDAQERIRELIEKKYYRQLADEKGVRRTIAALSRLGYSYHDIRSVLDEFNTLEDETEV